MARLAVKICMLGAQGVGKSCLAVRFVEGIFDDVLTSTIGASFLQRDIQTNDGTSYHFQIWDTAGQERFKTLARLYYRGASVIIIVFDVTKRSTLNYDVKNWMNELKKNCDVNDLLLVLVGNKVDIENKREVDKINAQQFARTLGAIYWEASAKTGFNVEELFADICETIDENEHIKESLVPKPAIRKKRLTVVNHSGKRVDSESQATSSCCK